MLARILAFFRKTRLDRELDAELASHLDLLTDDNIKRGMRPETARREALLTIGSFDAAKELHRDTRGLPRVDSVLQDMRLALRMIRKSPWISGIAVVSLAVGIGVNITAFAIARTILWEPLPLPQPDQLVAVYNRPQNGAGGYAGLAYLEYEYLRSRPDAFDDLTMYLRVPASLVIGEETERVAAEMVSSNYFQVLGARTIVGRGLQSGDDRALGSTPEIVISYDLWQRRFSSDPTVVGTTLRLERRPFTVVGVAAPGFRGVLMDWIEPPQVWIPINMYDRESFSATESRFGMGILDLWRMHSMMVAGRLKQGVTAEAAQSSVRAIDTQMSEEHPERLRAFDGKYDFLMDVLPIQRARFFPAYRNAVVSYIQVVSIVMAIVLGIACLNLANLMIARASTRVREMAVRAALGASRLRLVRQMVIESLMLSCLGGIVALPLAVVLWRALLLFERPFLVVLPESFTIDVPLGLFAAGVSVGTGIFFGVWPAWRGSKVDLNVALSQQKGTAGLGGIRVRSALIAFQIAASVVLLVGGGLFIRTVRNADAVDRFVDRTHIGVVDIALPVNRYSELLQKVRALPGVERASVVTSVPGARSGILYSAVTSTVKVTVDQNNVSTDYFKLMGIPILSGRDFTDADAAGAPAVVIVNESLARRLWPGADPIGQTVSGASVIGVVPDTKSRGARNPAPPTAYSSVLQGQSTGMSLLIQTSGTPASVFPDVRGIVRQLDPAVPLVNPRTFQQHIEKALSTERLAATLVGTLGIVALCLTLIGLYGVVAFSAAARSREIGIRMAVGARVSDVLRMMFMENMAIVVAGLLLGLVGSFAVNRTIESFLFGVESTDAASFVLAASLILASGFLATLIPSWSVSRLDPSRVLRND